MPLYTLLKADNPKKKYKVYIISKKTGKERKIEFGAAGMSDFTKHKDEARKQRYIDRHKANENWDDPETAGYWALNVLWNKTTIGESFNWVKQDLKKRGYI